MKRDSEGGKEGLGRRCYDASCSGIIDWPMCSRKLANVGDKVCMSVLHPFDVELIHPQDVGTWVRMSRIVGYVRISWHYQIWLFLGLRMIVQYQGMEGSPESGVLSKKRIRFSFLECRVR